MKYRAIPADRAQAVLQKLREGGDLETGDYEVRGEGKELPTSLVTNVAKKLDKIRAKYPKQLGRKDPDGGRFEAEACSTLHSELNLEVEPAGDADFWTWLAMENRDLVEWRHGEGGAPARAPNFGIGDPRENLFYRMWLRADIGRVGTKGDPYALARRGGNDFWRSHILRINYGKCRPLAHAFLKAQFPSSAGKPKWKTLHVRDIAKRLTRLHPTVLFEALDEKSATTLIQREASLSRAATPP